MDGELKYEYGGFTFAWDSTKAGANLKKHNVSFKEACSAVLNEVQVMEDAGEGSEQRWAVIAYALSDRFAAPLYVVVAEQDEDVWRIISARLTTGEERRRYEEEANAY